MRCFPGTGARSPGIGGGNAGGRRKKPKRGDMAGGAHPRVGPQLIRGSVLLTWP